MKLSLRTTAIVSLLLLALFPGCRSRPKAQPTTTPAPVSVSTPAPASSVDTSRDFIATEPERDLLPSDLYEMTRMAQERGWLRDAFFAFDTSTLDADARDALSTSARWLRDNPQYVLLVEGHTDERGTSQYNLALGDRRAETAREYLVQLGLTPGRVRTVSFGEERPFSEGSNESAWARNRRAHLVLVSD